MLAAGNVRCVITNVEDCMALGEIAVPSVEAESGDSFLKIRVYF